MRALASRSQLLTAARPVFIAAMLLFVVTIVVGILNGLDVYEPDFDTLVTHVHAGTLGWITLAVSGVALLMFSSDRTLSDSEVGQARAMAYSMIGAITLYVAAFLVGDRMPGDRIQRPIVGTLLFLVVIWFLVWLFRANSAYGRSSIARLGLLLSWVSLLVGALFGVVLGIYTSQGEVLGLPDDTAAAVAEAHPPAMVIGFLILAAMAIMEWLLRGDKTWAEAKAGSVQMWLIFGSGVLVNIAFLIGREEEILGPANLIMIVGVIILVSRSWSALMPDGWRGAGTGIYPRISTLFLIVYLVLLTAIVVQVINETMDFDALTDTQFGLVLTFDHVMFIGVMTNLLFGSVGAAVRGTETTLADRILLWGVNVAIVGFALGLITVTPWLKRVSTPVLGAALLVGIALYVAELSKTAQPAAVEADTTG